MKIPAYLLLLSALALSAPVTAQEDGRAVIHFADLGGIEDWRVAEDDSLLIEGRNGNWYRATFFGPCHELKFTNTIGFITDVTGDLDKFSSILVDGRRCSFRTFERIPDPEDD